MNKQQQQIDGGGGGGGVAEGREEHNTGEGLSSIIIVRFILGELPQSWRN